MLMQAKILGFFKHDQLFERYIQSHTYPEDTVRIADKILILRSIRYYANIA